MCLSYSHFDNLPSYLSANDLVDLGIYKSNNAAYLDRRNGQAPPFIKPNHKRVLYPKKELIEFLKEKTINKNKDLVLAQKKKEVFESNGENEDLIEDLFKGFNDILTSHDLVNLGLYKTINALFSARKRKLGPPYIKMNHLVCYPKQGVIKFLKDRLRHTRDSRGKFNIELSEEEWQMLHEIEEKDKVDLRKLATKAIKDSIRNFHRERIVENNE